MWKFHKREETMISTDAIIYLAMIIGFFGGFIFGRWEKQNAQTKMYRHGFHIGKQVGRNEGK
jgi:hypothetical protein